MLAPDEDPGKDVPVVKDTDGVVAGDTLDNGSAESDTKCLKLLHGLGTTAASCVHGSDGHGSSSRSREHEAELTGDVDDKKFTERSDEEKTEEGTDKGQGEDPSNVVNRVV